jgi:transmembrane sensor
MQKRNLYQSVENFLDDKSFRNWVLEGHDPHEWEEWTQENPHKAGLVEEAREWLLALHISEEEVADSDVQEALEHTWDKIRAMEDSSLTAKAPFWRLHWRRVAASVLLAGALLAGMYQIHRGSLPQDQKRTSPIGTETDPLVEKHNSTDRPLLIMLTDGSSVLLQPKSTLRYPPDFDRNERKVYLSGDAFFEISKNPDQPCVVYANELVTRVVGTSFRIKAFADQKNVEVVVRTGKVNVMSREDTDADGLLLLPNQGARLARQNLKFEKIEDLTQEKRHSKELSTIEKLSFEFTDASVSQIFKTWLRSTSRLKSWKNVI